MLVRMLESAAGGRTGAESWEADITPFPVALRIDRSSPVPLYFQVAEQLEREILAGALAPGARIANEVALAEELGLSRPTLRQAIQTLVDKGMLVRKRGVGTQVVNSQVRRKMELTSLYDDLTTAGRHPETRLLSLDRSECYDQTAAGLHLAPGSTVWRLRRLRLMDGGPLAVLINEVPTAMVDLSVFDLSATGLYAVFRAAGIRLRVADQRIGARRATSEEAALLNQQVGDPVLSMERTAFDDSGQAVEHGTHVYRPDLYSFEVTLVDR